MKKVLITDGVHPSIIKAIEQLDFEVTYIPKMAYEKLGPIISEYEGIIINSKIIMNKAMIDRAEKLHFIGRLGSGLDIIDLEYAAEKNIEVISAPEGNCNAVGEHAMGMLLALANNMLRADAEVRSFKWNREKNRGFELEGRNVGIIGYGHTGPAFAEKLQGFRCNIFAYDKYRKHFGDEKRLIKEASLEEIKEKCEIISIHLPLTPETKYFVDLKFIDECKNNPIIINTSRGKILKIDDLISALEAGKVKGACLDVFENEKTQTFTAAEKEMYGRLYEFENVILSPHIAGWTKESKKKIALTLIRKIQAHMNKRGDK
ncbi:NAD(P)-dependent oxidoreductase [Portibacter lacus]|uniref:2-hydroxyacid dehydrogenase n=1 Tax=Portibacter lacus TaxID=1099794 RepID=A0AA37SRE3_9BACT|nr:NAD(P)-dependent oxidoreductase [Portibacter lacus]GLR18144.1 2-hydroxyacid dehydrogenase [Portibacter lacus]